MNATGESGSRPRPALRTSLGERLALAFLLAILALGSLALWTAVPAGTLWALSQLDLPATTHLLTALVAVPAAITVAGLGLLSVNSIYLRVTAASVAPGRCGEEDGQPPMRGPLESLMIGSLAIAFATFIIWLIFFAENPQVTAIVAR